MLDKAKQLYDMAARYLEEKAKWKKAGKPVRTDEKIKELFSICVSCEHYKKISELSGSCGICGCHLKNTNTSLNKLAWATTKCPLENPKWEEEQDFQSIQISQKEIEIEKATPDEVIAEDTTDTPAPTRSRGCGCGG